MNSASAYVVGPAKAPILPDGSFRFYREILTPDGCELIGREYPDEGYCWVNIKRTALLAGFTHDQIWEAEQASRDLLLNPAYIKARMTELAQELP